MIGEWCYAENCRYRHWRSGDMPTHRKGEHCPRDIADHMAGLHWTELYPSDDPEVWSHTTGQYVIVRWNGDPTAQLQIFKQFDSLEDAVRYVESEDT